MCFRSVGNFLEHTFDIESDVTASVVPISLVQEQQYAWGTHGEFIISLKVTWKTNKDAIGLKLQIKE